MQDLQEKSKRSRGYNRKAFEKQIKQTGSELINEILKIKVLDPAMGSGHFLVEATDFLAHALVAALNREVIFEPSRKEWLIRNKTALYEESTDKDEIRWARRQIVERCIYGHHLKCGNSLIGARVEDLISLPNFKKKKREEIPATQGLLFDISPMTVDLGLAVGNYFLIEDKLSNSLEDIKDKEKIYEDINRKWMGKWRRVANLWTSSYFGVKLDSNLYKVLSDYLLEKDKRIPEKWVKDFTEKASKIAKEKHFFHWELEFPEVFFDRQGKKLDNPGFDVVVGNPPYVNIYELSKEEGIVIYISSFFRTALKKFDLYIPFAELSYNLSKVNGYHSFIVPDKWLYVPYGENLRKLFVNKITKLFDFTNFKVFEDPSVNNVVYFIRKSKDVNRKITIKQFLSPKEYREWETPLEYWHKCPFEMFRLTLTKERIPIMEKLLNKSIQWGEIFYVNWGCRPVPFYDYFVNKKKDNTCVPAVKGEGIQRYNFVYHDTFLRYIPDELYNPMFRELFENKGIFIKDIGGKGRICAMLNNNKFYTTHTVNVSVKWRNIPDSKKGGNFMKAYLLNDVYDIRYCLAIANSFLTTFYYLVYLSDFLHTVPNNVRQFPIRRISFITPKEDREKSVEEGKKLYEKYLENGNCDSLLFFTDQRLKRQYIPDPGLAEKHNTDPFNKDFQIKKGELVEQSDVIHDLLAFLAEKMIEYNKEKNKEIKSFLEWLEREAGAKVEDLTRKTTIKKYHETTADNLINVFKKNKKKLQIDPSRRDFQDKLSTEFNKSIQKLIPLKRKIEMTDHLIDQIVYKLYELTEEEIRIVKEGIKK